MAKSKNDLLLLPLPQEVRRLAGTLTLADRLTIALPPESTRPELTAARQLAADLAALKIEGAIARSGNNTDAAPGGVALRRGKVKGGAEAYELKITKAGVDIIAAGPRGHFYGVQTLQQLIRQFGRQLPALVIRDWPEFALRGVYHDISRGRVPTVETLKYLVELLAHLKVNTFSLYIEYPYRYERHPRIWEDTEPLTAGDILEVQEFCQERCIDFIPSQASFGHLERLLSKPPYHRLANTPPRTLEQARNFARQGTSLDPTNPRSVKLLAELYDEFLPQFDSPYFNACCDEVWDLGDGKSAARAKRVGKGRLFAEFIAQIHQLSAQRGKRLMIWADILKHHPEAIRYVPQDTILLNWWYEANSPEWMIEHSRAIRQAGHELIVCPGVNNWCSFMPRLQKMRDNIRNFAAAGQQFKALGLQNTEWGDGGHFNLLATALPGLATGAEHSWAHTKADETTIGRRWPLHVLGDRTADAEKILAHADGSFDGWHARFTGLGNEQTIDFAALKLTPQQVLARQEKFNEHLQQAMAEAIRLTERFSAGPAKNTLSALAAMEWTVLSGFALAKGQAVVGQMHRHLGRAADAVPRFRQAVEMAVELLPRYKELWLLRNRRSELAWSVGRFQDMIARWHRSAKGE